MFAELPREEDLTSSPTEATLASAEVEDRAETPEAVLAVPLSVHELVMCDNQALAEEMAVDTSEEEEAAEDVKRVRRKRVAGRKRFVGSASVDGGCPYQEDRVVVVEKAALQQTWEEVGENGMCAASCVVAVLDGHGGEGCADYVQEKMGKNVCKMLRGEKSVRRETLVGAFERMDAKFRDTFDTSGACVCMVCVEEKRGKMYVANVGDCRCVVFTDSFSNMCQVTVDHKPNLPAEKKRIQEAGHYVDVQTILVNGKRVKIARVDGALAVSRSIGDDDLKDYNVPPHKMGVSPTPDVFVIDLFDELQISGLFVLMASDGLWDVMTNDAAVSAISTLLEGHEDYNDNALLTSVCEKLVDMAVEKGSVDNTTAVLMHFPHEPK